MIVSEEGLWKRYSGIMTVMPSQDTIKNKKGLRGKVTFYYLYGSYMTINYCAPFLCYCIDSRLFQISDIFEVLERRTKARQDATWQC